MKKFSNILLILSLTMGLVLAIPTEKAQAETSAAGGVVKNYYDPMFYISMVRPTDGSLDFAMNSAGTGLYLHRVVLAYYNYEDGVTEREADARIAELGAEGKLSWGTVVYDFAMNGFPQNSVYGGGAMELDENGMAMGSLSLAEVNKSDVLYYAAEFGEKTGSGLATTWSNSTWARGKIDYRDCIHGSNYVNYGECKVVHQDGEATAKYWTYGRQPAADVHIMTWDEEWQGIQKGRLDEVEKQIEKWEKLEDFAEADENEVAKAETDLDKLKTTLAKTEGDGAELLRTRRDDLAARLRKLQGKDDTTENNNNNNNNVEEGGGQAGDGDKPTGTGSDANSAGAGQSTDTQGNAQGSVDVQGGAGTWGDVVVQGNGNIQRNVGIRENVSNDWDEQAQDKQNQDGQEWNENEQKDQNEQNGQAGQKVEVPNLGGGQKMNVWVFWLPLLAGLLLVILVALRKIWQRVREKNIR